MRIALVTSILFIMVLSSLAEAQLTKEDVRQIIKEENAHLETRLKQYIDAENAKLRAELKDEINKNRVEIAQINGKIASLKEGQGFLKWVMGFVAALVIGAIAIPSMVQAWRERKESKRFEQIISQVEQLAKVVDILKDEVLLLKEQRIVKP